MAKTFTPRPYQRLIIDHVLRCPRAAVWAGMGMGKTVSTLTAIKYLQDCEGVGKALILAPLRVAQSTWPDEVAKWAHLADLRVSVVTGNPDTRKAAVEAEADIYCTNYDNLPWLVENVVRAKGYWPFDIVVADESTRLKSLRSRGGGTRARALAKVAFESPRFVELTGTPAPNGLEDLWGQFWFLDRGDRLGRSMSAYRERFFRPERVGSNALAVRWIPLPHSQEQIHARTADLTVKLNPEKWFDIKKPIVTNIEVTLPEKARKVYRQLEHDMFVELETAEVEAVNAAVLSGKCLQIANGAIYTDDEGGYEVLHSEKLDALRSIVEEAAGMPVLVSYTFKSDVEEIMKRFKNARHLDKDPQTIRDWNAGKIPMLIAHPASAGHGLNLQDGGNILVFFSTGWNLEEHDQMVERIGPTRQKQAGHDRPVFIYNIIAKDTLDAVVQERIATKREVLDLLMERKNYDSNQAR